MVDIQIKIEFHSPWHCGSGLAAGADIDALVIKDQNGMPYLPGKTIKGLVRQATEEYVMLAGIGENDTDGKTVAERVKNMFGAESSSDDVRACGTAHFSDANFAEHEYHAIAADKKLKAQLFNKSTTTAIGKDGIARAHSLRSEQTVVPCTLYATISGVDDAIADTVVTSLGMIKRLGQKRHRGFGRCTISEFSRTDVVTKMNTKDGNEGKLQFRCELLSDIVLNQKSSTEGNNTTLDFIPGNVFLGIVAKHYEELGEKAMAVFHSGLVRFGDAHPMAGKQTVRSLRVPASFYYPKMKRIEETCYIHHIYNRDNDTENNGGPQQLKQCRNGFYAFADSSATPAPVKRTFAIKSAYDREKRRSEDEQMYGYESLCKGASFLFEVDIDEQAMAERNIDASELKKLLRGYLKGPHRVGRSRTAQYGLVNIEPTKFENVGSTNNLAKVSGRNLVTVYADSRLIFLDENREPTFRPTSEQLGIPGGEIDWKLSQVRTFQYAPWNGIRASRDNDRCGIEKGSVFVVAVDSMENDRQFASCYIGSYCNEGFGRVIYNPDFLTALPGKNGKIRYKIRKEDPDQSNEENAEMPLLPEPLLCDYLKKAKTRAEGDEWIYEKVNDFVDSNSKYFREDKFASQWGTIRALAMRYKTYNDIKTYVIGKCEKDPVAYITHGTAKGKWEKFERRDKLEGFVEEAYSKKDQYGDIVSRALINLSSEMAKQSKKER